MHQITKIVRHLSTKIFEGSYVEKSQCIFVLIALATAINHRQQHWLNGSSGVSGAA